MRLEYIAVLLKGSASTTIQTPPSIFSSENESDIGYRSSASDQESFCSLFENKSKKINKGRWTKEEVLVKKLLKYLNFVRLAMVHGVIVEIPWAADFTCPR